MAFGLFLIILSSIVLYETRKLIIGTASNMGPGYVPRFICFFMLVSGIVYTAKSFFNQESVHISQIHWKSVLLIVIALASFALTLEFLGLFVSTLVMIFFASLSKKETRWGGIVIFSVILSLFTVIVFKIGFKLPLPVLPVFLR
jgi:hypothetical protein